MSKNSNLRTAAKEKNDEFYTQIADIENELNNYKDKFRGKVVFLNCDDPEESHFWKYFSLNFEDLGIKKLVATHYKESERTYRLEISRDTNGDGKINGKDIEKTMINTNGDFRSPESIEILKEADIVVTNPPFSLFREYIAQLKEYDKDFLIVGPAGAAIYKGIIDMFMSNDIWFGVTNVKRFEIPREKFDEGFTKNVVEEEGKYYAKFGNVCWFTNLDHSKRHETMKLRKRYYGNEENYPKYDNLDAINIDRIKDIPGDYKGKMGVPISILNLLNPKQFEILDCFNRYSTVTGVTEETRGRYMSMVNGKAKFTRVLVRNKGA